jgi:hypothetical protein
MASSSSAAPTSALREILRWSATRPEWQQDALRRIIENGALTSVDEEQLYHLCLEKHGANEQKGTAPIAAPLSAAHLPLSGGAALGVSLVSVGEMHGVNRIPDNQVLEFGQSPGLTIIYGNNGAGKSGYARVIKKACRSRGSAPVIRGDAFAGGNSGPATAKLTFDVGGTRSSVVWKDGDVGDASLRNVFVFDSTTAGHYLDEDGPASFTPLGLDVLPKLSKCADAINSRIQSDIEALQLLNSNVSKNWNFNATTEVGRMLAGLSAKTKREDVRALATFAEAQKTRLKVLNDSLRADPKQKARETRAAAWRVRSLADAVLACETALGSQPVGALCLKREAAIAAREIAKSFSEGQFDSSYLPGTGEATWRKMWDMAREFSESWGYPGERFPLTRETARCPLCQQELNAESAQRLEAFDRFCKDHSQILAVEADKAAIQAA